MVFAAYYAQLTSGCGLDFVFTVTGLKSTIAGFSADDIAHHLRGTAILDTIFPILYGSAICLAVLRYTSGWQKKMLLILEVTAVAADFVENAYNMDLLSGGTSYVPHVVATWIKFAALIAPLFVATKHLAAEALGRQSGQS